MLDEPLLVPVPGVGKKREVFEAFLYGIYAHSNPDQRRKVRGWQAMPHYGDLEAQFYVIVAHLLNAARAMAAACQKMLDSGKV